jgi:ABC-type phosphate transport system substrate-binding protein
MAVAALFLCAPLLAGCAAPETPIPTLGPLIRIAVTPWHAPQVLAWAQSYAEAAGPLPFDVEIVQAGIALQGMRDGTYALAIGSLSPGDDEFATPLGEEGLGVVLGSGTGLRQLTRTQLAALLAGRTANWSSIGGSDTPVLPIVPLPGDDVRAYVEEELLKGSAFASAARLVATPEQGLALLREEAGAVLLLPLSALPSDLPTASIDGLRPARGGPADGAYPLIIPRRAIALEEPGGAIRDWLGWVQGERLATSY